MIIAPPALRTKGGQSQKKEAIPPPNGVEVEVLIAGKYNGPDHKSIGEHQAGAIIVIASGGYSSYLIQNGFVRPTIAPETSPLADLVRQALLAKMEEAASAEHKLSAEAAQGTSAPHPENTDTVRTETDEPDAVRTYTENIDPDRPWLFWTEAGVIESVAVSLWEAGFTSPNRALELGMDMLLGVKGVGPATATKVLAWAEAHG